jgi:ribosomal protein S6
LNHNKGHYAIFQIEGPSESALELESKLKYDTSVIRHLMLKVDSPSLEDSLLLVESREAKKSPQEEDQSQEKSKASQAEIKPAADPVATEESKDDE